jgi:hypothetical protein
MVAGSLLLAGCGGSGGGGGDGDNDNGDQALLDLVERLFPFIPNQPFDVIYQCARQGSALTYTLNFKDDGTFDTYTTLDTGADVGPQSGTYTYQNDELHLQTTNPPGAILINLDEFSTTITPAFGLLAAFQTPGMTCVAIGHRENSSEFGSTVHYDCPNINIQAVSFDVNAIEFVHRAVPYDLAVPGSAFRARDRFVSGNPSALVARGYGLYRRMGDDFYIAFPPGSFDDNDVLSGRFKNGNLQISVDQLEPERGDCSR